MQLNFNHFAFFNLGRQMFRLRCIFVLWSILVMGLASSDVNGQAPFHRQRGNGPYRNFGPPQPRNFGDTPSPTEMLARLKFHKHQETPLFDLLREAGSDIFSKLSDNEKKLAGRFVEDMILKEGMDSERVSSLMEHMNISPEARQALQEGIERAGGGEAAVSPEDRKAIANNVRQQFLQQFGNQPGSPRSPSNQTTQQSNRPTDLGRPNIDNRAQTQSLVPDATSPTEAIVDNATRNQQLQQRIAKLAEALKTKTRKLKEARDQQRNTPSHESAASNTDSKPRRNGNGQLPRAPKPADQELAESEVRTKPSSQTPAIAPSDTASNRNRVDRSGLNRSKTPLPPESLKVPGIDLKNNELVQEALRQFQSQSEEDQQRIFSEIQDKLRDGDLTPRQMEELFSDLQSAKSPAEFAERIDEASKILDLPADSREKIMGSLNRRSGTGRSSSGDGSANDVEVGVDKIGRDLLQDALQTYNDPDSGYELSGAFKRLKDHAEGIRSERPLANFGNISKKLFEDSSKIFDADSTSDSRQASGVKPGQRLDQLLTAAASEAIANSAEANDKKGDSVFSSVLNSALGTALDQAVTLADDGEPGVNGNDDGGWNTHTNNFNNDSLGPLQDFGSPQPNSASQSPNVSNGSNPSLPSTSDSSPSQSNSIQESVSAITESILDTKFSWRSLFLILGLVGLLALAIFLLSRILTPADPILQKQAELQRKLQQSSANPKDVVEAVDLFLLSRFGDVSSWWNAKHAADQVSEAKPDRRDKVASLFQVYRWSRYQAAGKDSVSPEQNKLVVATLQELLEAPPEAFGSAKSSASNTPSTDDDGEVSS